MFVGLMKQGMLFSCLMIISIPGFSQSTGDHLARIREEKIETILRIQDTRTIFDSRMISLLGDPDPVVRQRVVLAYANLQDTTAIPLLVDRLSDRDPSVQDAAAFAIGQTAGQLTPRSKERLEHDLIWARLDRMSPGVKDSIEPIDRLIEEIGKVGTQQALSDLVLKFGTAYPPVHRRALTMSIARFAIRNITTPEAVQYLLRQIKPPDGAPWDAVYALQRIGAHQEIRNDIEDVVKLYKHRDPLVRMHLATLLGKIRDELTSLQPLYTLAEFDPDWRVRVSALRALAAFPLQENEEAIKIFQRAFHSGEPHVAITAISSFGNTGLRYGLTESIKEATSVLERMAMNPGSRYIWQIQAEASIALAKLRGGEALEAIRPDERHYLLLRAQFYLAMGLSGSPHVAPILLEAVRRDDHRIARAALEGLLELSRRNPGNDSILAQTYSAGLAALESRDMAMVTTAASLLGDTLFLRSASVRPLIEALASQQIPHDIEAIQAICATLGKIGDARAIQGLQRQLEMPDRSVALAAANALRAITGRNHEQEIPKHIEPLLTDFDFSYLRSLPNPLRVRLETIRGDIIIELFKDTAPFTVMSFLKLATQRGFYRGLPFHRVVPNFVIQGGDPRGDGWGGPGYSIRSEFSPLTYEMGQVGMASAGKDTEGSQFFITHSPQPHLDGRYTIFGKVINGMSVVNKILVDDHIFDITLVP